MGSDSEVLVKIESDVSGLQDGAAAAVDSSKTIAETLDELKTKAESGGEGLDKAGESAGAFGAALSSVASIAAGVDLGLLFEKAAGAAKDFFESATLGSFEFGEKITNLSIAYGLTTDQLQIIREATLETGTSFDSFGMIVNRLSRVMLQFSSGDASKQARAAAEALQIDPTKYSSAFDLLEAIEDRIKSIGDLTLAQRGALEQLFGRGVLSALPFIEKLRETEDEMRSTGQLLSPDMVKAQDEAAESINRLGARWDEFKHIIGGGIAESVNAIVDSLGLLGDAAAGPEALTGGGTGGALRRQLDAQQLQPAIEPGTQTQAQLKSSFEQSVADYEASQREIMAAAGDTAEARIAYEKNVHDFLVSQYQSAAAAGVDLSSKIAGASVAEAAAQNAAAKESAAGWKAAGLEVQTYIREQAKMQNDALDTMYADFKVLGTETLEHIKEKWGELDAAEQQAVQDLKANSEVIASAVTPITSAFEQSFTGVIQGTQTMNQAWKKMLDSMGLELLKSGLHDLLLGGTKNTIGAEIFGTTGEGGGIAGAIASAFSGSAVSAGLKASLTNAWTGLTAPISNVFGQAFNAIGGIIKNLFGSALSGAGSSLASAGVGAAAGAATSVTEVGLPTSIEATLTTELSLILGALVAANVALDAMNGELITLDAIEAAKIVQPFGFSGGGIVPSAAGGMISGGGLAILHPREMVLPANLSEGVQRAIGGGTFGGGGGGGGDNIVVNLSISAIDGPSVENLFNQGRVKDLIGNAVLSKVRDARAVGQGVHRGVFRR